MFAVNTLRNAYGHTKSQKHSTVEHDEGVWEQLRIAHDPVIRAA